MDMQEAVSTPVIVKTANAITYAAAGGAFAFGMTASELGVLASIALGACTLCIGQWMNFHFKQKHYKLVEKYVLSGQVDRRQTGELRRDEATRRAGDEDRRDGISGSPCALCPAVKHQHDFDNT